MNNTHFSYVHCWSTISNWLLSYVFLIRAYVLDGGSESWSCIQWVLPGHSTNITGFCKWRCFHCICCMCASKWLMIASIFSVFFFADAAYLYLVASILFGLYFVLHWTVCLAQYILHLVILCSFWHPMYIL
jgi:hypothetical protein